MDKNKQIYQFGTFLIEEKPYSTRSGTKSTLLINDSNGNHVFVDESTVNSIKSKLKEFSEKTRPLDTFAQDTVAKYDFSQKNIPEAEILITNLKDRIISKDYVLENITPKIRKTVDKAKTDIQKLMSKYEKNYLPIVEKLFKETILENKPSLEAFPFPIKYAEKMEKINSNLEKDVAKILAEPTKKKSIIAPILLGFGIGGILGGAYVFGVMKDGNSKLIENLTTPDSTGTTMIEKYVPLNPDAIAEKDTIYVKGKDGEPRYFTRKPGKSSNEYSGDFEDWEPDTVFVPTSNEQDKKRIVELEKQIGGKVKTIIPKKIKIPGKQGNWMYVKNIFLTGSNEYQGQLEGLIPDTIEVKGKDGEPRYFTRKPGKSSNTYSGDFEDWAEIDTVFVPTSNEQDKKLIQNLERQLVYCKNLNTLKPDTVKTKDTVYVEVPNVVPNEAMNDSVNYWKSLYRNKKGDVYKNKINLNGLNLKVNPNTKIYKTNGGN